MSKRKKESVIEATLRVAKKVQPDLWKRTQAVAEIIDPAAFAKGWIINDEAARKSIASRRLLDQATAMHKAQEILHYLGVNTETDWAEILKRLGDR